MVLMIDFRLRFFEREDFIALLGNEFRIRCYRRRHALSNCFLISGAV